MENLGGSPKEISEGPRYTILRPGDRIIFNRWERLDDSDHAAWDQRPPNMGNWMNAVLGKSIGPLNAGTPIKIHLETEGFNRVISTIFDEFRRIFRQLAKATNLSLPHQSDVPILGEPIPARPDRPDRPSRVHPLHSSVLQGNNLGPDPRCRGPPMPKHIHSHPSFEPFPPDHIEDKKMWLVDHCLNMHALIVDGTMRMDEVLKIHRDDHANRSFWAGE